MPLNLPPTGGRRLARNRKTTKATLIANHISITAVARCSTAGPREQVGVNAEVPSMFQADALESERYAELRTSLGLTPHLTARFSEASLGTRLSL